MNIKKLISFGKGFAIAVLVFGIIHDIATFTPIIREGLVSLNSENFNAMIYMSLICGLSFILSGLLMLLLVPVRFYSIYFSAKEFISKKGPFIKLDNTCF